MEFHHELYMVFILFFVISMAFGYVSYKSTSRAYDSVKTLLKREVENLEIIENMQKFGINYKKDSILIKSLKKSNVIIVIHTDKIYYKVGDYNVCMLIDNLCISENPVPYNTLDTLKAIQSYIFVKYEIETKANIIIKKEYQ